MLDGRLLDAFSITKTNGRDDAAYLKQAVPEEHFGELRALVQPFMRGIMLEASRLTGDAAPLRFKCGAGEKAMDFEVHLERRAAPDYEMKPVKGHSPAGDTVDVETAIRLRDPAAYRDGAKPMPILRLECVFVGTTDWTWARRSARSSRQT
jgi:hypothetical protein